MSGFLTPDVLVLAAGGIAGEAWMTGVLAGIEDATGHDFGRTEQLVGTSAGSIVAAALVAGERLRHPPGDVGASVPAGREHMRQPALGEGGVRGVAGTLASAAFGAAAPLTTPLLRLGAPAGAVARALVLGRIPDGRRSLDGLRDAPQLRGARFDGRLRIVAVDQVSGRRVVFGAPDAPRAPVGAAVAASCAVPGYYRPVTIGGRVYVDGGAWSPTNLDVARVGRGSEVLCLSVLEGAPLASVPGPLAALRAGARVATAVEAQALRRRGARVRVVGPDRDAVEAIGGRLLDPGRAAPALAAGYRQGLALDAG
jgi:NTE family protein